jgi:2-polyprenyl-6-methoxyphenol hydroxylase-like FAD-dependent oxidoreductase
VNVLVAGAGPAGLYFAYLAKLRNPAWKIRVVEQNRADSTFGFGVVFSDRALEFLRGDDPATYDLITPRMESWVDLKVVHRGTPVVIDGIGFAAIGRLELLKLLQQQAAGVGVVPQYETQVKKDLHEFDLVVAADGVNSTVRGWHDFGTTVSHLTNKFAWYGTPSVFDTLTQTFVSNEHGSFNAHHYRHSPKMSTFVVECDAATWAKAGFAAMDEAATIRYLEKLFGHKLVSNRSVWRNFPNLRNRKYFSGNVVLIGDALRTAHFSIGSGTRLAMEDAIALVKALDGGGLPAFEAARRPIVDKLLAAADASGSWYDRFPEHMKLAPREFAWSYIQRSGRIDPERLRKISPKFVNG